jgi:hypothetical protein
MKIKYIQEYIVGHENSKHETEQPSLLSEVYCQTTEQNSADDVLMGFWHHVDLLVDANTSEKCTASIFRADMEMLESGGIYTGFEGREG